MIFPRGEGDFYHKYRPRSFDEIVGQASIVRSLRHIISNEHSSQSFLFFGESGTGKTTVARIMAMSINCENRDGDNPCCECSSCKSIMDGSNTDVHEINASDARGIDEIRRIREDMALSSMLSKNKIYILDECHALTKDAQSSLLKVLEEAPKGVYIILCSTDPQKLLKTVINRCQKFQFKSLSTEDLMSLVDQVCTYEGLSISPEVVEKIVGKAEGSARNTLVYLQQIAQAGEDTSSSSADDILAVVKEFDAESIELCRLLLRQGTKWTDLVELYKSIQVPQETIRFTILGYCRSILLSGNGLLDKTADIMTIFIDPLFDSKPENSMVLNLFKAWKRISRL